MATEFPMTKVCTSCGIEKPLEEFSLHKEGKFGRRACCKKCRSKKEAEKYASDPEYRNLRRKIERDRFSSLSPEAHELRKAKQREWRNVHREQLNARNRERYQTDETTRLSCLTGRKRYYEENKDKVIANETRRQARKRATDLNFRLRATLRSRLLCAIKADQKVGSAISDLGCSVEELKTYLESKFQPGMTWENWGRGSACWNIDHIIPLVAFNLTDRDQFLAASHYTNLQPLWEKDNLSKGGKYQGEPPCPLSLVSSPIQ